MSETMVIVSMCFALHRLFFSLRQQGTSYFLLLFFRPSSEKTATKREIVLRLRLYHKRRREVRVGQGRPVDAKRLDRVVRCALDRQLAQDAPDQAGELERVARADRQRDLWVPRQRIDHKVAVGRQRIQAGFG